MHFFFFFPKGWSIWDIKTVFALKSRFEVTFTGGLKSAVEAELHLSSCRKPVAPSLDAGCMVVLSTLSGLLAIIYAEYYVKPDDALRDTRACSTSLAIQERALLIAELQFHFKQ